MGYTPKATYVIPSPLHPRDRWVEDGIGAPCPVVSGAGSIRVYHSAHGPIGFPAGDIRLDYVAEASGFDAATIMNFMALQSHNSIGVSQMSEPEFLQEGEREFHSQQIVRPSFPFMSWGAEDVTDPYVLANPGGGITNDKTCSDFGGRAYTRSNNFGFYIWVMVNGGAKTGDIIAQKGVLWSLKFSDDSGHNVVYEYLDDDGKKQRLGPLSLIAKKGWPYTRECTAQNRDWTDDPKFYGEPTLIFCGPGVMAVSTHESFWLPVNNDFPPYNQHNFIFDESLFISAYRKRRYLLNMQGEPLTLGNDWTGQDFNRFDSGGIISARIAWEHDPLNTWAKLGGVAKRGISLFQQTFNGGPGMTKTQDTTWLVNMDESNGDDEVLDTGTAFRTRNLEPYNLRFYGGAHLNSLVLDDAVQPKNFEMDSVVGTNSLGNVYVDVRVPTPSQAPWNPHLGPQSPGGLVVKDDEDGDGTDASISMVISTRDRTQAEEISVYAWEDIGVPADEAFWPSYFTVHRLYLSSAPLENYPLAHTEDGDDLRYTLGLNPYLFEKTAAGTHHYKMLVVDLSTEETFNFGYAMIPDFEHHSKMVYVGYMDGVYSLIWNPMGWGSNPLGCQRSLPIYLSENQLSAPALFRFNDDLYVVFTEGDNLSRGSYIHVYYKKMNTLDDWYPIGIPFVAPTGVDDGWDGTSVQMGGLLYNDKTRQILMSYLGYDGTSWTMGKAHVSNLIAPLSDNRRDADPISETITPTVNDNMRGVGPFIKVGSRHYLMYTDYDSDTAKYFLARGQYEFDESEVIPGEEFGDYDAFLEPDMIVNRVKALHRYYKRNGEKMTLAVIGTNIYRGADALDDQDRLITTFAGVGRQTDISTPYLGSSDHISMENYNDWIYTAQKNQVLTKWAGGLIKTVGVIAPTIAPTGTAFAGGTLPDGTYTYKYTYFSGIPSESNPSAASTGAICAIGSNQVTVEWTVPPAGQPDVVGVKVYRKESADTEYVHIKTITSRTTDSFVDDGSTDPTATGAAPPADHTPPVLLDGIAPYGDILVGWVNNTLYWSKSNQGDYWPDENVLHLDSNGEDITVAKVIGHQLAVFTATKIFIVTQAGVSTDGRANTVLSVRRTRAPMGTVAPKSVVVGQLGETNGAFYLGTDRNIWMFTGEDSVQASEKIFRTTQRISKVYMSQAAGAFWNNHYILCAPFKTNVNNAILDLDLTRGAWSYHPNQHISVFATLSSKSDGYLLIGGDSRMGNIYQVFDPTCPSDDGIPIFVRMKTKTFDLGMPETEKRIRKMYYDFAGVSGTLNITIRVEDDTVESSSDVPVAGYTFMFRQNPLRAAVTMGTQLSQAFGFIPAVSEFGVLSDSRTGFHAEPRDFIGDAYAGAIIMDMGEMLMDNDKYIVFPAEIRGRNFSIEITSADASSDFQLDSLSLLIRAERQR